MFHGNSGEYPTIRSVSSLSTAFGLVADSGLIPFLMLANITPLNTAAAKHNIYSLLHTVLQSFMQL
jgi:hypothetical protein